MSADDVIKRVDRYPPPFSDRDRMEQELVAEVRRLRGLLTRARELVDYAMGTTEAAITEITDDIEDVLGGKRWMKRARTWLKETKP